LARPTPEVAPSPVRGSVKDERAVLVAGAPGNRRDVDLVVVVLARILEEEAALDGVVPHTLVKLSDAA
jgi:hypothetical protein